MRAAPARSAISAASAVVTRTPIVRLLRSASGFRGRAMSGGLLVARGMSLRGSGGIPRPEVFVKRQHIWLPGNPQTAGQLAATGRSPPEAASAAAWAAMIAPSARGAGRDTADRR